MQLKTDATGGCYCGEIRFKISQNLEKNVLCHCENCRKISGGAVVAWTIVRVSSFQLTHGKPATYLSDTGATWSFCPNCGTTISYQGSGYEDQIDITMVSLDEHRNLVPAFDANETEKLGWIHNAQA